MSRLHLWHKHVLKKDNIYKLKSPSIIKNQCLDKVIINLNVTDVVNDSKNILPAITALELITFQKPKFYYSRKSIAAFKLRKHTIIGSKITLQNDNLFNFLDILVFIVLPKLNNFKGFAFIKPNASNNISIGLTDLTIFPQINENIIHFTKKLGCTVTFFIKTKDNLMKNLIISQFQIPKINKNEV